MTNIIKKGIIKIRNKMLGSLIEKVHAVELSQSKSEELSRSIQESVREIQERVRSNGSVMSISDKELAVKIINDIVMYLDPRDIAVVPHIVMDRIWEREITVAWLDIMNNENPEVVFDIGANFGYFGLLSAQRAAVQKRQPRIVLFEANPELIPYLEKSLSVNWFNETAKVENVAISDVSGSATLNVLKDYTGSSSMHTMEKLDSYLGHTMKVEANKQISMPTISIDEYCKKNGISSIDLIKMDIEGFEEKAYKGMKNIVKKSANLKFFIEFTKDGYENPEEFYKRMLADFGYVYLFGENGQLVAPKDNSYNGVVGGSSVWTMLVFTKRPI